MAPQLEQVIKQTNPSRRDLARLVVTLSIPTILAELSAVVMQYIDAGMVGSLGANASAAVGLVASSTWLMGGLCTGAAAGFSVQVAQLVGAGRLAAARNVFRQSLVVLAAFSVLLAAAGCAVSPHLPVLMGGEPNVCPDATSFLFIYALAIPAVQVVRLCTSMLQCTGDMRTPSRLNILMCLLDVVFNFFFIFPTRTVTLPLVGWALTVPGAGWGVAGAAAGTVAAEIVVALLLLRASTVTSPALALFGAAQANKPGEPAPSWRLTRQCLGRAVRVAAPLCLERAVMSAAQITSTAIVAPLGTVAVAAHSLAITAESVCYMPGYGVGSAATTLVGQSLGANNKPLAKRLGTFTTVFGMVTMGVTGLAMFFCAPWVMSLLTPDAAVQQLGANVLRIEVLVEPFFAASIVAMGAMRGAGDTLVPSLMNLGSMWGVRIPAAALMAGQFGLYGVWIAMTFELALRGVIFLVRLHRGTWLNRESMVA